jgi:hypothetical protein
MMGLNSFKTAKVFFGISAAILIFRVAMFGLSPTTTAPIKIACIAICGLISVLTYFLFRWVDRKAGAFAAKPTTLSQTVNSSTDSINVANTGTMGDVNYTTNTYHAPQNVIASPLKEDRTTASEWEQLADRFKQCSTWARADYQTTNGKTRWTVKEDPLCEVLCKKAGAMLLNSPKSRKAFSPMLPDGEEYINHWLEIVKRKTPSATYGYFFERQDDGSSVNHFHGVVNDIARTSSRLCLECSIHEI